MKMKAIPKQSIESVNKRKYFFMHQSVGDNLIDGIKMHAESRSLPVTIMELDGNSPDLQLEKPGFYHTHGGKNGYPFSKIESFVDLMSRIDKEQLPQIAFMKFCFLDFPPEVDPNSVFDEYNKTISKLQKLYPDTKFVHLTAPLMETPNDFKTLIKRLLGKQSWVDLTNMKREEFNRRIREKFPKNQVFDIALYESIGPDGIRETRKLKDFEYYALDSAYTDDGSHLNELGKRVISAKFLEFLHALH